MKRKWAGKRPIFWLSLLGTLLIIAGVSLALFPFLTNIYSIYFSGAAVEAEELEEMPALLAEENDTPDELDKDILSTENNRDGPEDNKEPAALEPSLEGIIVIPSLDLKVRVGYGVELENLRNGPMFYPQSEHPATGNTCIAGHRTTYGAWFRNLDKLEEGDDIFLYYDETIYSYRVDEVFEVHDRDWSVIDPTPLPALTLTTCHPPGWATQRLVVRAYQAAGAGQE